MLKLLLPTLLGILLCLFSTSCKKEDDCACPIPESNYDPDFVVFPTKNATWVVSRWGSGGVNRVDTFTIGNPIELVTRKLPYNATDLSNYEPEGPELYYPIKSRYYTFELTNGDTTNVSPIYSAIYTHFRVDTAAKKLYEVFTNNGVKYEIESIDWTKGVGDTLFFMDYYNVVQHVDSILIGEKYIKTYNSSIWQGGLVNFFHEPSNFFGFTDYYKTMFIYKNDTIEILW